MADRGSNPPNGWLNRFGNRLRADMQKFPANVLRNYNRIRQDGFTSFLRGRPPNAAQPARNAQPAGKQSEFNLFEEAFRQEVQWPTQEQARFKLVGDVRPAGLEAVPGVEQTGSGVDRIRPSILARRDKQRRWGRDTLGEVLAAGERAAGRETLEERRETLEERRAEVKRVYKEQYDKQRFDRDRQRGGA